MNLKLTRRQFGQLAIVCTAATAFGYLANRTFAQTSNQVFGVSLGPILDTDDTATPEVDSTDDTDDTDDNDSPETVVHREIVIKSLDLGNNQVQTLTTPRVLVASNEQLTGFTSLSNGTLVVAITPVSSSKKGDSPTRLEFLSTPAKTLTIVGLKKQNMLAGLAGTNDGKLVGLVLKKNGTPPVRLGEVNLQTGEISFFDKVELPQDRQVGNLVQCRDGKFYATAVAKKGDTELLQLDLGKGKPSVQARLKFNDVLWNNGLQSLVCSSTGQLLAFGAPRYVSPNRVYSLDEGTGTLDRPKPFNVLKITTLPS